MVQKDIQRHKKQCTNADENESAPFCGHYYLSPVFVDATLNLLEGSTFGEKRSSTIYVFERGKEKIFFFWDSEIEVNCTGKILVIDIVGNTEEPVCGTTVAVKAGEEPYWVIIM
ncbi:MAG: hypothetical protein HXS48_18945 [Theionarchaea archaeon]|nr:hypothetical protein [Theionarchaea archaeon]